MSIPLNAILTLPAPMFYSNNFQKNVLLAPYTTFRIGGPAKYFFAAKTSDDLIKAVDFARQKNLPFFILGGGSNLLVSDRGFKGLIIKTQNSEFKIQNSGIFAEAGVKLRDLVLFSIEKGLTGLEWAVGIPGTVGGAVKVNAGAFGGEMKNLVKRISKIDEVIVSVELELQKSKQEQSRELIKEFIEKRKLTQPVSQFCAGCVFKNPEGRFAGQLIDQAGLKGRKFGGAVVSEKHANFIVNPSRAKASDVVKLIDLIKKEVKEKFNVELEEEIQYLGF